MSLIDYVKVGNYYVKYPHCDDVQIVFMTGREFDNDECEVIAPVPSYDEWEMMKALAENGQSAIDTNQRLAKVIKQLKDLLKECKTCLKLSNDKIYPSKNYAKDLLTRVDAAIGESEE